jgi:hypothetical protein
VVVRCGGLHEDRGAVRLGGHVVVRRGGLHEDRGVVRREGHEVVRCGDLHENRGAVRSEDLSEDQQLNHVDLYLGKIKRKSLTMVLIE